MSELTTIYSTSNIERLDNLDEIELAQREAWNCFWECWRAHGSPRFNRLPKSWLDYTIDGVYQGLPSQARFVVEARVVVE